MAATTPAAPSMAPTLTAFMPAAFGATAEVAAAGVEETPVTPAATEEAPEETDDSASEAESVAEASEEEVWDGEAVVSAAAEEDSPPAASGLASTNAQRALVASRTAN